MEGLVYPTGPAGLRLALPQERARVSAISRPVAMHDAAAEGNMGMQGRPATAGRSIKGDL